MEGKIIECREMKKRFRFRKSLLFNCHPRESENLKLNNGFPITRE